MQTILNELKNKKNARENLSDLRKMIKDEEIRKKLLKESDDGRDFIGFIDSEDAKTRKNAALLLGELECNAAAEKLFEKYKLENTLFVKGAYLNALSHLKINDYIPELENILKNLISMECQPENRKHIDEQIRELRKIIILYKGITRHVFSPAKKMTDVIFTCGRENRDIVLESFHDDKAKAHPLGVAGKTDRLTVFMKNRLYREMLFPIHTERRVPQDPFKAADMLWKSDFYKILSNLHTQAGTFYYRIEIKGKMSLEERSRFSQRLASELDRLSDGNLVNSSGDYEVELRLIEDREGMLFPCIKLYTVDFVRFPYRKNYIPSSINPATAATIMELSKPYMKENAQIIDPFCGVGTMLIERDNAIKAKYMYATDIFGDAIEKGRENALLAGKKINFIHRDFFDFKHDYLFDEIITNMPVSGKKTRVEMDEFYRNFFDKANGILVESGIIIMYCNETGLVKKQLRLHSGYILEKEYLMQKKNDFRVFIIRKK